MWGGPPSFLFRVMGKCKPYWYTKGAGSSINSIAIGSSSESLFWTYFVMHPVLLYYSISGHWKPYGSQTLGYRVKICNIILVPKEVQLPIQGDWSSPSEDRTAVVYGTIRFMGVRAKDTAGAAGGVIPSDLFLVVIYRFRHLGWILYFSGSGFYKSSICDSRLAWCLWICVHCPGW